MKYLLLAGMAGGLAAFTAAQEGSITGTIAPPESQAVVWTVVGSDTLKATADATTGAFEIPGVPAGDYTVTIDAVDPYHDATMEVTVADGQATDVGEIALPGGDAVEDGAGAIEDGAGAIEDEAGGGAGGL